MPNADRRNRKSHFIGCLGRSSAVSGGRSKVPKRRYLYPENRVLSLLAVLDRPRPFSRQSAGEGKPGMPRAAQKSTFGPLRRYKDVRFPAAVGEELTCRRRSASFASSRATNDRSRRLLIWGRADYARDRTGNDVNELAAITITVLRCIAP